MLHLPAGREASPGQGVHRYERHRPEQTLLYQFVEQYYPAFVDQMAALGATLPKYVQREFDDYLSGKAAVGLKAGMGRKMEVKIREWSGDGGSGAKIFWR
jgi:hypothetical protein